MRSIISQLLPPVEGDNIGKQKSEVVDVDSSGKPTKSVAGSSSPTGFKVHQSGTLVLSAFGIFASILDSMRINSRRGKLKCPCLTDITFWVADESGTIFRGCRNIGGRKDSDRNDSFGWESLVMTSKVHKN